jgi:hypothetical protein
MNHGVQGSNPSLPIIDQKGKGLSGHLGALAGDPGCFPLQDEFIFLFFQFLQFFFLGVLIGHGWVFLLFSSSIDASGECVFF